MLTIIIILFVLGYLAIALEHQIHINKAASAILTGVLCWTLYALNYGTLVPTDAFEHWQAAHGVADSEGHGMSDPRAKSHCCGSSGSARSFYLRCLIT
ncbi:MAG: hypothetical protein LW850_00615 [Planctomycetaceae bacterium]|nr:hypothetical protein [Planctomycetaceae bacterium]